MRTTRKAISDAARAFGSLGGKARAKKLSTEAKRAIAKKAARARWGVAKRAE